MLLLPIHFPGDTSIYYLQFDTGSPYTLFYSKSIKNIEGIIVAKDRVETSFYLGNTKVLSDKFKIFDNEDNKPDPIKIIGTLGADILENNKTLINFRENYIAFNLSKEPKNFKLNLIDFKFKKRKIIIPAVIKGKERKFLYDSGTSAYELLTDKEEWENLKLSGSKVVVEEASSWKNALTSYTAKCNQSLYFKNKKVPLNNVTYVEGFSQTQYLLMKFSGMTGMLGNKIFLKNNIFIDCVTNKIGIE